MKNNANTTQIINTYLRGQQLLNRHLQLCQAIKKADRARQSQRSTFQVIILNKSLSPTNYGSQSA